MYTLTEDQYDAFFLAATNLLHAIHEGRDSDSYAEELANYTAMLTGKYPQQAAIKDIVLMAKASERSTKSVEAIVRCLIGDFAYPHGYWKKHSISMCEVEALGGIC